jgi:outer membrane receptor protein involved in Fe transport
LDNYAFPTIGRDSYELVFEWTNFVELGRRDRLTFGTLFNYIEGAETFFGLGFPLEISRGTRPGGAFYGQWDHQLSDAVKVVGGFQANKIEGTGMNVAPRVGVIWNPTSHFNAKALYSGAFRAPSLDETYLNHPGLAGTPGLLPEKVGTLDLSVGYQANRFQGTFTFFRSRQTDSISIALPPDQGRAFYANFGKTTFHGFELEGKHYLRKNFYLTGSISYQADEDANATNPIPVPGVTAKAGFSYRAENGLTFGMFDNYQGALRTIPDAVNPGPVAFHLISAHARYDLSRFVGSRDKGGVALFAHAENLANHQIWLPDLGDYSGDTLPVNRGRTVYFGIDFSLGKE